MSNKNSLKDKIRKPGAAQTFFNQYDDNKDIDNKEKNDAIENDNNENADNNNNDKTYVNDNNVVDNNNNKTIIVKDEDDDYLRTLALGSKPKKKKAKKVFTSFYMDSDLSIEIDKIMKNGEKGDKSKLINTGIRRLLQEYGVIK